MLTPLPRLTLDETLKILSQVISWAYARGQYPDEKSLSDHHPRT